MIRSDPDSHRDINFKQSILLLLQLPQRVHKGAERRLEREALSQQCHQTFGGDYDFDYATKPLEVIMMILVILVMALMINPLPVALVDFFFFNFIIFSSDNGHNIFRLTITFFR